MEKLENYGFNLAQELYYLRSKVGGEKQSLDRFLIGQPEAPLASAQVPDCQSVTAHGSVSGGTSGRRVRLEEDFVSQYGALKVFWIN